MVLDANYEEMFQGGMEVHLESFEAFTKYKSTFLSKYFIVAIRVTIVWGTGTSIFGCSVAARFVLAVQRRDSRGVGPTAENSLLKIFHYSV